MYFLSYFPPNLALAIFFLKKNKRSDGLWNGTSFSVPCFSVSQNSWTCFDGERVRKCGERMCFLSFKNKKRLLGHGLEVFLRTRDAEPPSLRAPLHAALLQVRSGHLRSDARRATAAGPSDAVQLVSAWSGTSRRSKPPTGSLCWLAPSHPWALVCLDFIPRV